MRIDERGAVQPGSPGSRVEGVLAEESHMAGLGLCSIIASEGAAECSIIASEGAAECSIIASEGAAECSIIASEGAAETAGDAPGEVHAASAPAAVTTATRKPARPAERDRIMAGLR
jgi:hypothetical protein